MSRLLALTLLLSAPAAWTQPPAPAGYDIVLDVPVEHDDGKFLWFHPRAAAVPGKGKDGMPLAVMTLQKHLQVSDFYSELYYMLSEDLGKTWTGPVTIPEFAWRKGPGGEIVAVCDVTPGWHARTGKVIAIGAQLMYREGGALIEREGRFDQTAYTVFDPDARTWTAWKLIEMPEDPMFQFCRNACSQWIVEPDGTLLLPLYHGRNAKEDYTVSVGRFRFDGTTVSYVGHGNSMSVEGGRGLCEPSMVKHRGRYFLTLRNDARAYVTAGADGLHYDPIKPWTFDDGGELGSYNTQQHWLATDDALFLVYTRRGANNDHVMRNRAPLFIAQVDPESLQVLRATERVLIPERGAALGNFGAAPMTPAESWVTVGEGVWNDDARKRGAKGALFVARVRWN